MQTPIKTFVGIDPGTHGGMVILRGADIYSTSLDSMNLYDMRNWIETYTLTTENRLHSTYACLEKVGGFMGSTNDSEGRKRNVASAHTMFTFGESYGALQMLLVCCRISVGEVTPRKWQGSLGIKQREKGETKPQFKNRLKERAQCLFPERKITLDVADAFLLAYYLRGLHR